MIIKKFLKSLPICKYKQEDSYHIRNSWFISKLTVYIRLFINTEGGRLIWKGTIPLCQVKILQTHYELQKHNFYTKLLCNFLSSLKAYWKELKVSQCY